MSSKPEVRALTRLTEGQEIPFDGDRVAVVPAELAAQFVDGDRLIVVQSSGALLRIPAEVSDLVEHAVADASRAFAELSRASDDQISEFFERFAAALADDERFGPIAEANAADVAAAAARQRSTTRLVLDDRMRRDMIDGLRGWRDSPSRRDGTIERIDHAGWSIEARRAPLGVVGFVFEGRPNVFADACGVVRTGNTVVFRIGSDALATARSIVEHALVPALRDAGLPEGTVRLVDSPTHAAGHALFADQRLALAVARGSGAAVAELGAVASQAGTPVSLHGTGGAWMLAGSGVVSRDARPGGAALARPQGVQHRQRGAGAARTRRRAGSGGARRARRGGVRSRHLRTSARGRGQRGLRRPRAFRAARARSLAPAERSDEPAASTVAETELATEWEWEHSPEITLAVVESLDEAVETCNRFSPHFVASIVTDDVDEFDRFYAAVDAPFVGNGFTRWVDGQYALNAPELGLSNWQFGRMLGRGAILSGDSVFTVRYRATVVDHAVRR